MDADRHAPAFAEGEVSIDAPRALVWQVLTDFVAWPQWSPGVTFVTMNGDVEPGTGFRWKSGRNTIKSKLVDVEPPGVIVWTGRTTGIKAVHAYQLSDDGAGTTVRAQESWNGIVVKVLGRTLQPTLQSATDEGLAALKLECERRASPR